MIKVPEDMTKEELIETTKDLRKTLTELHIRFLRGLVMELESGEIHIEDLNPLIVEKFRKFLSAS